MKVEKNMSYHITFTNLTKLECFFTHKKGPLQKVHHILGVPGIIKLVKLWKVPHNESFKAQF